MLKKITDFFSYWYFRYLLVTELYMVEKWERVFIHVFFFVFFSLLWYFNTSVILNLTNILTSPIFSMFNCENQLPVNNILPGSESRMFGDL